MQLMLLQYASKHARNGCIIARYFTRRANDAPEPLQGAAKQLFRSVNTRQFLMKNQFTAEIIANRYKQDKLDPKEWCLIYYEPHYMLLNNVYRLALLIVLVALLRVANDYDYQSGRFRNPTFVRVHSAAIKLGIVAYFILPPVILLSMINLWRIPKIKLSRIYLNRQNPEELLLVKNRFLFFNKWAKVERKDVIHFERKDQQSALSTILYAMYGADARFGRLGKFSLSSRGFRTNAFQTYVFNQTKNIPKSLLDKIDLESNLKK